LQAAGFVDPVANLLEDFGQKGLVEMLCILKGEVQILGEAIGLEIALLSGQVPPLNTHRGPITGCAAMPARNQPSA
jgi:hypothetical protein